LFASRRPESLPRNLQPSSNAAVVVVAGGSQQQRMMACLDVLEASGMQDDQVPKYQSWCMILDGGGTRMDDNNENKEYDDVRNFYANFVMHLLLAV
jgi:hypothetical protein